MASGASPGVLGQFAFPADRMTLCIQFRLARVLNFHLLITGECSLNSSELLILMSMLTLILIVCVYKLEKNNSYSEYLQNSYFFIRNWPLKCRHLHLWNKFLLHLIWHALKRFKYGQLYDSWSSVESVHPASESKHSLCYFLYFFTFTTDCPRDASPSFYRYKLPNLGPRHLALAAVNSKSGYKIFRATSSGSFSKY